MRRMKLNCWEFKDCGRQPGGARVGKLGICPAAAMNRGRSCWAIAGTFCGGEIQGTFAHKRSTCMSCEFFLRVKQEEGVLLN